MEDHEFRALVQKLRDEQKAFFRTRNKTHLDTAKKLEAQVDKELLKGNNKPNTQQSFF
jgi:hypothetical protein